MRRSTVLGVLRSGRVWACCCCIAACTAGGKASVPNPLILEQSTAQSTQPSSIAHAGVGAAPAQTANQPGASSTTESAGTTAKSDGNEFPRTGTAATAPLTAAAGTAGSVAAVGGSGGRSADNPRAGTQAPAPVGGSGGASAPAGACKMTVDYTAVGSHGMWYPHNIGAVWVEDANGKFIKTIERWAGIRVAYLAAWNMRESQHGQWPSCPFANFCTGMMVPDQVDVMTQATIFEDKHMHHATWSCKDLNGVVVPDGKYKLFFEEMENIYPTFHAGPLTTIEFEKTPTGVTLMPPDQAPFSGLKIVLSRAP